MAKYYGFPPPRKGPGTLTERHKRADRALKSVGKNKPGAWKRHNWLKHRLLNSPGKSSSESKTERLGRRVPHYTRHDLEAALGALRAEFGHAYSGHIMPHGDMGPLTRGQSRAKRLHETVKRMMKSGKKINWGKEARVGDRISAGHGRLKPRARMEAALGRIGEEFRTTGPVLIRRKAPYYSPTEARLTDPRKRYTKARKKAIRKLGRLMSRSMAHGVYSTPRAKMQAALEGIEKFGAGQRWTERRQTAAAVSKIMRHGGGGKKLRPKVRWGTTPTDVRNARTRDAISGVVSGLWGHHAKTRAAHIKAARKLARPYPKRAS